MPATRVIVVEDSLTVRRRLVEVLSADRDIEVVGEAADGKTAIELCQSLRPDVVTLDMMLPVMTGLAATEYIMAYCPTPILIVSASTNRGELFKTYDALAAGALDVLDKPDGKQSDGAWERKFIAVVKLIARIKVITHPRARLGLASRSDTRQSLPAANRTDVRCRAIAMGGSTGSPSAVLQILRALPDGFPLPILLVIHIAEPFGAAFAQWLDAQTSHRVAYAVHNMEIPAPGVGGVLMAPPDRHLVVEHGRLRLNADAERHSCRPSVDVLFESFAREVGESGAGCLLTGMGRDGAAGLLAIRRAGGLTLAQDEATSVIYGMPREAARLDAVDCVLPLDHIGPTLAALAQPRERR